MRHSVFALLCAASMGCGILTADYFPAGDTAGPGGTTTRSGATGAPDNPTSTSMGDPDPGTGGDPGGGRGGSGAGVEVASCMFTPDFAVDALGQVCSQRGGARLEAGLLGLTVGPSSMFDAAFCDGNDPTGSTPEERQLYDLTGGACAEVALDAASMAEGAILALELRSEGFGEGFGLRAVRRSSALELESRVLDQDAGLYEIMSLGTISFEEGTERNVRWRLCFDEQGEISFYSSGRGGPWTQLASPPHASPIPDVTRVRFLFALERSTSTAVSDATARSLRLCTNPPPAP